MRRFAALALLAMSAPAVAADQFDLICTSKYHDATFHYRVDLAADLWCATSETKDIFGKRASNDRCAPVIFSGVGSDVLLFNSYAPFHQVDRVTGEWYYKDGGEGYRGSCERAPFSGFPELGTKF